VPFDIHSSHRTLLLLPAGIYLVLVAAIAIYPAVDLLERYPSPEVAGAEELEAQGERLFKSHGCVYCHTQQIRGDESRAHVKDGRRVVPVLRVDRRFGLATASAPEDYAGASPPLLGTQRTGPDLTGVGDRLPELAWHHWHLYDPQSVSPGSVMQPYRFLYRTRDERRDGDERVVGFDGLGAPGGEIWATPDAQALVEYLVSLKRPVPTAVSVEDAR
jgi:cytochrome c oxidase cbb3-type subunit 2